MSENLIHIAMAVHDKTGEYVTHTATTLVSVFMHTQARIQVHLLKWLSLQDKILVFL